MGNANLKPCPFCGGTDSVSTRSTIAYDNRLIWTVECKNCKWLRPGFVFMTEQGAINAWNTRHDERDD